MYSILYSHEEVMENRRAWIAYLKSPEAKKAKHQLETTDMEGNAVGRCCLGHGCHVLGVKRTKEEGRSVRYDGRFDYAPHSFMSKVGLYRENGAFIGRDTPFGNDGSIYISMFERCANSLAYLNDSTELTPQAIGEWLETVIDGGPGTPFIKLG